MFIDSQRASFTDHRHLKKNINSHLLRFPRGTKSFDKKRKATRARIFISCVLIKKASRNTHRSFRESHYDRFFCSNSIRKGLLEFASLLIPQRSSGQTSETMIHFLIEPRFNVEFVFFLSTNLFIMATGTKTVKRNLFWVLFSWQITELGYTFEIEPMSLEGAINFSKNVTPNRLSWEKRRIASAC